MKLFNRYSVLLAAGILMTSATVAANPLTVSAITNTSGDYESGEYDHLVYLHYYDDTIKIVSCNDPDTEIIIPSEIEGKPVTRIESCFGSVSESNGKEWTSVTVPSSITELPLDAFYDCKKLTTVELSEGLEIIGDEAFRDCESLASIKIPEGVTSIGVRAFLNCEALTSVEIPASVTHIDQAAFDCCEGLTSITILNPSCEIFDADSTISSTYRPSETYYGTICGYDGSTAQAYAEKYGYSFTSLGAAPAENPAKDSDTSAGKEKTKKDKTVESDSESRPVLPFVIGGTAVVVGGAAVIAFASKGGKKSK